MTSVRQKDEDCDHCLGLGHLRGNTVVGRLPVGRDSKEVRRKMSLFKPEIKDSPEVQERVLNWIAALRSGEYKQAKERLRIGNDFCCLGVACNLYDPKKWKALPDHEFAFRSHDDTTAWDAKVSLSDEVMDHFMLQDEDGGYREFKPTQNYHTLAGANDSGQSFKQIAKIIEKELQKCLT